MNISKAVGFLSAPFLRFRKASAPRLPPLGAEERAIARAIADAVLQIKSKTTRMKVIMALERGDTYAAVDAIKWGEGEQALLNILPKQYRNIFESAGELASSRLPFKIAFNVVNPNTVNFAGQRSAALIREFGRSSRAAVQVLIERSVSNGIPPRELAKLIVDSGIGLTERQAAAVARYHQTLRMRAAKGELNAEQVQGRVARYSEKLLKRRGETIARTELITASREGTQESWRQAAANGLLDLNTAVQVWMTAPDERLCPICEDLDGAEAKLGESFPGGIQGPPAHPQCRCSLKIVPK
jgi:hypothetical protein